MANALRKNAEVDPEKIAKGVEVTFFLDDKPFRTTITRGGEFNEALQRESEKLMRPYRHSGMTFEQLPPATQKKFFAQLYSKHVVIDWNADDFQEAFSKEAVEKLMTDVDEYRVFIITQSMQVDKFRKEKIEEVSGNSEGH